MRIKPQYADNMLEYCIDIENHAGGDRKDLTFPSKWIEGSYPLEKLCYNPLINILMAISIVLVILWGCI